MIHSPEADIIKEGCNVVGVRKLLELLLELALKLSVLCAVVFQAGGFHRLLLVVSLEVEFLLLQSVKPLILFGEFEHVAKDADYDDYNHTDHELHAARQAARIAEIKLTEIHYLRPPFLFFFSRLF